MNTTLHSTTSATIKYPRRTTGAVEGNGLGTTINYLHGVAGNGLGTTIKYLRRTPSAAEGNGLGTTINLHSPAMHNWRRRGQRTGHHAQMPVQRRGQRPGAAIKYLRRTTSAAAGNGLGTTINEHSLA
jgi:hypothetical protein